MSVKCYQCGLVNAAGSAKCKRCDAAFTAQVVQQVPQVAYQPLPEIVIHQDSQVTITNTRAVLFGKTYAMAQITSVSMIMDTPNRSSGLLLAVFGGFGALCGVGNLFAPDSELRLIGFIVSGVAAAMIVLGIKLYQQTRFIVRVGSASGESNAVYSPDLQYVQRIVGAMNEAIVRRG